MGILLNQFLDKIYLEMIIILTFLQEVLIMKIKDKSRKFDEEKNLNRELPAAGCCCCCTSDKPTKTDD
ncbi:hypothetical protein DB334_09325 [Lactobacillus helveticus]|uniref:Uncharacterized protein n=1 Tax=Lactobacillus helveticus TaxID=1587 RepID=A0A3S8S9X3_LACHE|nr:hypothetical protein LH5_00408 [Lactobacillus helveticus]PTV27045.1 hypothetical protein DB334_09325 [Lactobacillus helveticus]